MHRPGRLEQPLGQVRLLQDDAHEDEQRDRHQDRVIHDGPDTMRHQRKDVRPLGQ
jgi:hypothetical protein